MSDIISRLESAVEGLRHSRAPQKLELGRQLYGALMANSVPGGEVFGGLPVRLSQIMPEKMGVMICVNGDYVIIDCRSEEERATDLKARETGND